MDNAAVWIILLGIWIFFLQNRVKELEKIVKGLNLSEKPSAVKPVQTESKAKEADEIPVITQTIKEEVLEEASRVEVFKQTYTEPKQRVLAPAKPSKVITFITEYFSGGNLLVRIGGVVLFFGLAFLVKYATEHSIISMEMRLWAIALTAVVLIVLGWKLRKREGAYGQILQGLGIAMLYLVIYGAAKFYTMLSLDIAFMLMLAVVLLGSILAVIEDALPLALFSTAGGFLVPILTSSGEGSHIILFSYYAFLNIGVFIVAWYRSWRALNVLGFLFTFVIASAWGVLKYNTGYFATTEPFLILYFAMYLCIAIVFTLKHPFEPKNFVDSTLVFGLPLVAFPLQLHLVKNIPYGDAWSAVTLGLLYLGLWQWLKAKERTKLLAAAFLVLGALFLTIAIPYIFNADVSAALWSVEGAAAIWLGLKQARKLTRYFGMLMLSISIIVYPDAVSSYGITIAEYLGYLIIIVAALAASYLLDSHKKSIPAWNNYIAKIFLALGIVLWFTANLGVFPTWYFHQAQDVLLTLIMGATLLFAVAKYFSWKLLSHTLQGFIPLGLFIFLAQANENLLDIHPFTHWGGLLFAALFTLHFLLLYAYKKVWKFENALHLLGLWFIVLVTSLELHYHLLSLNKGKVFEALFLALVPLLASLLLLLPKHYKGWLESYRKTYQQIGVGALMLVLLLWELAMFFNVMPQGTVALFNLLDLMQLAVLLSLAYWVYHQREAWSEQTKAILYAKVSFLGLVLLSVLFARYIHYTQETSYTLHALWHSNYFQTGLSLLWSMVAIILMLLSKRYSNRSLWMAGFGLLIVVVLKLFFVELASSGTVERIISFMVVGGLLLVIGYFVPLPPSQEPEQEDETND